jgi:hypothetical protein
MENLEQLMKLEQYKAELQLHHEQYKAELQLHHEQYVQSVATVMAAGQTAIKSALIVNAGAAVAVLAFMGNGAFIFPGFCEAVLRFGLGVFFAIVAGGTTYLSQHAFAGKSGVAGHIMQGFSCVLIAAAYLFFLWGIYLAYGALRGV